MVTFRDYLMHLDIRYISLSCCSMINFYFFKITCKLLLIINVLLKSDNQTLWSAKIWKWGGFQSKKWEVELQSKGVLIDLLI